MVFSLESQRNRENPFFSIFLEIVLRLQRERSWEGSLCIRQPSEMHIFGREVHIFYLS